MEHHLLSFEISQWSSFVDLCNRHNVSILFYFGNNLPNLTKASQSHFWCWKSRLESHVVSFIFHSNMADDFCMFSLLLLTLLTFSVILEGYFCQIIWISPRSISFRMTQPVFHSLCPGILFHCFVINTHGSYAHVLHILYSIYVT